MSYVGTQAKLLLQFFLLNDCCLLYLNICSFNQNANSQLHKRKGTKSTISGDEKRKSSEAITLNGTLSLLIILEELPFILQKTFEYGHKISQLKS
eukprot:snap_masked-scaffold_2-processed-gene-18.38-mRNA-1 protein AED:1.00 eAED:1.00 QI:0/0/0/0/1/1/2/0/94